MNKSINDSTQESNVMVSKALLFVFFCCMNALLSFWSLPSPPVSHHTSLAAYFLSGADRGAWEVGRLELITAISVLILVRVPVHS